METILINDVEFVNFLIKSLQSLNPFYVMETILI